MFSTLRGFLDRHKKKLIVATALVGGTVLAVNYAQKRLREWQERDIKLFLETTKKKGHFESTERTCNQTVLNLVNSVSDAVMKSLDTDDILKRLASNPSNKMELWEELKILTFARATAIIYSFTILVVTSRIQLNLIGGYVYKESISEESPTVDNELRLKYMSLCNYFITEGIDKMCKHIYDKVKNVVTPVTLKQKLSLKDTEQLFWSIQASLCTDVSDPLKRIVSYVIAESPTDDNATLKTMVNETMDLLESEEVLSLSLSSVSKSFTLLLDSIAEFYTSSNGKVANESSKAGTSNGFADKSHLNSFVNVNNIELPFIKLIPILNLLISQSNENGLCGVQQIIIEHLILNDKLKTLGANIYEVFSN